MMECLALIHRVKCQPLAAFTTFPLGVVLKELATPLLFSTSFFSFSFFFFSFSSFLSNLISI